MELNVPTRLAGFALVLAAVFAVALLVGGAVGPVGASTPDGGGEHGTAEDHQR